MQLRLLLRRGGAAWPGAATVLALLMVVGPCCRRAAAIDPNRTLSQALLRKWQVQQGLPQATVFSIRQTRDGYLWLGSQTGLIRFDGMRFAVAKDEAHGLSANAWIEDLCEDGDRNLWIATDGDGLIRWKNGAASRYGPEDGLPWESINCLFCDRGGALWIGAAEGLARYRAGEFEIHPSTSEGDIRGIQAIGQSSDGAIWFGGEGNRLAAYREGKFSTQELTSLPTYGSVRAILGAADGGLWIGSTHGLVQLHEGQVRTFTRASGLADDWVCCLIEGSHEEIWAGTKDGISRIRGDEIECFRSRDGLSQSTVYTLCEDREGTLWAGTKHGLNQFLDRRTIPFTSSEGLPSNDAGPVLQDGDGTIWVGTLAAGLARFEGRRFSAAATAQQGLPSNAILSLTAGGEGELWIGTNRGLCRMRGGKIDARFDQKQGLPGAKVACLCRDPQGVLWAGAESGLARVVDGRFEAPAGMPPRLQSPILSLVDCPAGVVAAAAGGAVYRFHDGRFDPLPQLDSNPHDVVAIYCDSDNLLWLGTRGGGLLLVSLANGRFKADTVVRYSIRDGLYDDDIYGIVADDDDRLWMACSKGIFSVARDELLSFAAGALANVHSTPFSPTDALRTIECQDGVQPGLWKMKNGSIWFSTIRGLIVIDPARLQRTLPPASLVVEEVKVNGKQEPLEGLNRLGPGTVNLDFRYTALSFVSPPRIAFRYQLEGFDRNWVEAGGRREAFYTNLPPGRYRFRVMARNVDGAWREAPRPIAFAVEPYFYQTWWFMPLAAVLATAAAWGAYRLRVSRIKAQLRAVLAERSRIARELHDTLMQGFSGITMEMQALAARLAPSRERNSLEEIIRDAGACLREARRSIAGLRNARGESTGLAAAIAQAARQLTETQDMRLKLQLADSPARLPADVEYNLLRVAQEAIANAVNHSGGRTIEVTLEQTSGQLRLLVVDDGEGLAASDGEPAPSGHYGLIGMRERATQIGAHFYVDSEAGRGTTIGVVLPLEVNSPAAPKQPVEPAKQLSNRRDGDPLAAAPRAAEPLE